ERLPLKGVRVIDFSWIVAGPQATRILADFGAEVIRVEYKGRVDSIRIGMTSPPADPSSPNGSGMFNNLNRNKLSATANLNHPQGLDLIRRLIAVSDAVVENFSSRVMEQRGLSYEAMAAVNPGIIYLSLSGFGHSGRDRDYVTWGPTAQALSGLTRMSGLPDAPPAGWGFSYLDHTAGYYGAAALLLALYERSRSGCGQYIDIAQIETGMVLAGPAILDYCVNGRPYIRPGSPPGNHLVYPVVAPHNTYRCRPDPRRDVPDDSWVAIAVFRDDEWRALCHVMGDPDWCHEERLATNNGRIEHQRDLDAKISTWTSTLDRYDVMYLCQAGGVAAGVVQDAADRTERDPQLAARAFYPEIEHSELGLHRFEGLPFRGSRLLWSLRRAAPRLGEDTSYVLRDLLGLSDVEIECLDEEAAI
ncbi:MAG TPA: CoA transferase, partial [Dehalococcoidia bacterium]|nr:CoA transferase [Dehalococcoidia bacterium]